MSKNKIYLIQCSNDEEEFIAGYATTEEKANKMKEYLEGTLNEDVEDEYTAFEYTIIPTETNQLIINYKEINF